MNKLKGRRVKNVLVINIEMKNLKKAMQVKKISYSDRKIFVFIAGFLTYKRTLSEGVYELRYSGN